MNVQNYIGWFAKDILTRLQYLKDTKEEKGKAVSMLQIDGEELIVEEQADDGYANLKVKITQPCIGVGYLEKAHWGYMDYCKISDGLVIENKEGIYSIHIFELKKTVKSSSWSKAKMQWAGTLLYALMICGFLGITVDFEKVFLYLGYRYNKLSEQQDAVPIMARAALGDRKPGKGALEWEKDKITLEILDGVTCPYYKVQLDEEGEGEYCL